jgi:hypothetical protein
VDPVREVWGLTMGFASSGEGVVFLGWDTFNGII